MKRTPIAVVEEVSNESESIDQEEEKQMSVMRDATIDRLNDFGVF
jgi:hypothetical protein